MKHTVFLTREELCLLARQIFSRWEICRRFFSADAIRILVALAERRRYIESIDFSELYFGIFDALMEMGLFELRQFGSLPRPVVDKLCARVFVIKD